MIEYTKYQWIDQHNHDAFQWARNAQNIFFYDNELKNIYSLREKISHLIFFQLSISYLCFNSYQCSRFSYPPHQFLLSLYYFLLSQYTYLNFEITNIKFQFISFLIIINRLIYLVIWIRIIISSSDSSWTSFFYL